MAKEILEAKKKIVEERSGDVIERHTNSLSKKKRKFFVFFSFFFSKIHVENSSGRYRGRGASH